MAATKPNPTPPTKPAFNLPEGFEDRNSDIVGMWPQDEGQPIYFVPEFAIITDSKKFDKTKPSTLVFGKLTRESLLKRKGEEDDDASELFKGKPGDMVGVWLKPGMRDIQGCCGTEVCIVRDPSRDKDTDKGNPMKGFMVASKGKGGTNIPIRKDLRDKSAGVATPLDPPDYGKAPKGPIPF